MVDKKGVCRITVEHKDQELHHQFKLKCLILNKSMSEVVLGWVNDFVNRNRLADQ